MDKNKRIDDSIYKAIEFLKSSDDVMEVKTISAGHLNIVKSKSSSPLQFERTLYEAEGIINGEVTFPTKNINSYDITGNYWFSIDSNNYYYVPYTSSSGKVFARIKSVGD
jgi:hypothetical protein